MVKKPEVEASVHLLKTLPENFNKVATGVMSFQLRKNDRDYKLNDILVLQEYVGSVHDEDQYTGRQFVCRVNCILTEDDGLQQNYVLLNISKIHLFGNRAGLRYETKL